MIHALKDELEEQVQGDRPKVRMTVDLTPEFRERLEKLAEKTYLGNKATVIRHALAIYEYLLMEIEEGSEVVVRSPEGKERHLDRIALAMAS